MSWEKRDKLGNVIVKEGEVVVVLSWIWVVMGNMRGEYDDVGDEEDEGVELVRDLLWLMIVKRWVLSVLGLVVVESGLVNIVDILFWNLLFLVLVVLIFKILLLLDLFLI